MGLRRCLTAAVLLLGVVPTRADAAVIWAPTPGLTWQIQFSGEIDTGVDVQVYDLDMEETPAQTVTDLHAAEDPGGRKVVCYVNAGAWEKWRPDKALFPRKVRGNPLDGWPGERWLDIRKLDIIGPPLQARMDRCRDKGFDGIEFDNVDGYTNNSGFRLRAHHQLAFNEWLAAEAIERGLAPGLKNDLDQADELVDDFAFAINEQCLQYHECGVLSETFIAANKPVFHIEYKGEIAAICDAAPDAFSTVRKKLNLDAFRQACI